MNSSATTIGIIVPTYNRADLIGQTLESVLAQTRPADEIIVVDDGSTDDTRAVVAAFAKRHPNLHYVWQENAYLGAARNTGQVRAQSDLLLFLDSDDLLLPSALAEMEGALRRAPQAALTYCRTDFIDQAGALVAAPSWIEDFDGEVWDRLVDRCFIRSAGCVLIRRSALEHAGFWDVRLRGVEDWDMWLRLAERAPFARIPAPLFLYRLHGTNMSGDAALMGLGEVRVYREHLRRHAKNPVRRERLRAALRARWPFYASGTAQALLARALARGGGSVTAPLPVARRLAFFCWALRLSPSLLWTHLPGVSRVYWAARARLRGCGDSSADTPAAGESGA